MSRALVSLHNLSAESVGFGHIKDGHVSVVLDDSTQLHWNSAEDFEAFLDALRGKVIEAAALVMTS